MVNFLIYRRFGIHNMASTYASNVSYLMSANEFFELYARTEKDDFSFGVVEYSSFLSSLLISIRKPSG